MLIDCIAPGDCVEGIYATDRLYGSLPQFILIRNLRDKDNRVKLHKYRECICG